jgi:hypothetical protein
LNIETAVERYRKRKQIFWAKARQMKLIETPTRWLKITSIFNGLKPLQSAYTRDAAH